MSIRTLARQLDKAENAVAIMMTADTGSFFYSPDSVAFPDYVALMHARHVARAALIDGLNERAKITRDKFANRKRPISSDEALPLKYRYLSAAINADELEELRAQLGCIRESEWLEAGSELATADWICDEAQRRYTAQQRKARDDAAKGIVRHYHRRKAAEVHL